MPDIEHKQLKRTGDRRLHMANERTFLAWIRTCIGIMGFGFVVERFALFVKQMSYVLVKSNTNIVLPTSHGYSSIAGIFLVSLGSLMSVFSFIKYKKVERQIDEDTYHSSSLLNMLLSISVLAVGIFLVIFLIQSI
jgi:Predicted membrane protein